MSAALRPFGLAQPPIDPQRLALRILSEKRFAQRVVRPVPHTWWDAVQSWLADRWHQLMDAFGRSVHVGRGATAALGDLVLVAVVILLVVVGARLLMQLSREYGTAAGARPLAFRFAAADLYARAIAAAGERRYDRAVTLLFRATLASLDMRHALDDVPSRTVNECRRDVRARAPRFAGAFDGIARLFTAVAYANAAAGEAEWAQAREIYESTFRRSFDEA